MKKTYIAVMMILSAAILSCTALDRLNPTDPKAANYIGMHYLGSIGDFTVLEDFSVMGEVIWCVDSSTSKIYKYNIGGDLVFFLTDSRLTAPTGVCNDNVFFYVADKNTYFNNVKRYDPDYVSNTAQVQLPNYSDTYIFNKCAASPAYLFAATATGVYRFDTAGNTMTTASYTGLINISDIEYNTATNEVVVADSGADRLVVLSPSLIFLREIPFTFDILGFAIKDNYLYVPSSAGIRQFYYDSGISIKTFADYGEGSGMITGPGACAAYGDYVLVGTGTTIKYFGP